MTNQTIKHISLVQFICHACCLTSEPWNSRGVTHVIRARAYGREKDIISYTPHPTTPGTDELYTQHDPLPISTCIHQTTLLGFFPIASNHWRWPRLNQSSQSLKSASHVDRIGVTTGKEGQGTPSRRRWSVSVSSRTQFEACQMSKNDSKVL